MMQVSPSNDEILINVTPMETRIALIENGVVHELYIERSSRRGLVGNIYLGRVVRVLPGMQAAFVDVGLTRTAFIHASDLQDAATRTQEGMTHRPIQELLHEGQVLTVQVVKDMLGSKGARLSADLSIASRYLVFMPYANSAGVSQRIEDEQERLRLRSILNDLQAELGCERGQFIVRTAAEGIADVDELRRDMTYLLKLWEQIQQDIGSAQAPACIYEDLPLFCRAVRDLDRDSIARIRVDSRETYARLRQFAQALVPSAAAKLEHYPGERPIFELHDVEDDLQKALSRKVQLKSGGYLIIDQTEAMTTIDVNTGSFVGHRSLEDTVFKTNLEATQVIARQLRLRNLGGIIIIDFIDMQDASHRSHVLRMLERMLDRDHAKTKLTQVSDLGLVEMTRKRNRESLEHVLCESCPTCEGRGSIKSAETVCNEIFREIMREARAYDAANAFLVIASQRVIDRLLDEESAAVADLEAFIRKPIRFQVEAMYAQEHYDVVLV